MKVKKEQATACKRPPRNFTEAESAYAAVVAKRIREQRKRLRLLTEALADRARMSSSITQYRREKGIMGRSSPQILLCRYAMIFGCQPGDLLPPFTAVASKAGA